MNNIETLYNNYLLTILYCLIPMIEVFLFLGWIFIVTKIFYPSSKKNKKE